MNHTLKFQHFYLTKNQTFIWQTVRLPLKSTSRIFHIQFLEFDLQSGVEHQVVWNYRIKHGWRKCLNNSMIWIVAGIINHVSWIKSAKGSPANDLNWPLNYMTPCQYDSIWAFDERAHLFPICPGNYHFWLFQLKFRRHLPLCSKIWKLWNPSAALKKPLKSIKKSLWGLF